ncbi:carboxymuconolactone decarboxylase family protein [Nocardia goodfellowii]|uniref:Uncharacterized protein n=1 Tax=Nocardia goodfellowii TaxID=882446 RepID=A0ABS4Q8A9_9NOCA|nr:hypothetical protein [Nocardia goodfellowii]MBP2187923.1 hypothetical protein [Nocardia goodfellowii]
MESPVPHADNKRAAFRELVDRVLNGPGRAAPDERARAFHNTDVPPPLQPLIDKVATKPAEITDADFEAAAGFSEDQLFELVIAAAVGQSTRQYDAGLAALAEATGNQEAR